MDIAVLGANGVVGRALVPRLAARGHSVRALVRDPQKAAIPRPENVDIATADIFDLASLERGFAGCSVVVNVASAVPRPGDATAWDTNTRIRTEGTNHVIAAAHDAGVDCVVHQSVAMVHRSVDGAWVDEDSALLETPQTRSAIELERIVMDSKVGWQIVRGGLFYGPGTGREDYYRNAARSGELSLPGDGSDFLSLIHIDDMAAAIAAVVEAGAPSRAWLAVDDRPVTWRTFLDHFRMAENPPMPRDGKPNPLPSFRCRNDRLRALGWQPRFPDFTQGIA